MAHPKTEAAPGKELETRPDGWERFERAVDAAVKSGPKHRVTTPEKPAKKKGAAHGRRPKRAPK